MPVSSPVAFVYLIARQGVRASCCKHKLIAKADVCECLLRKICVNDQVGQEWCVCVQLGWQH